MGAALAAALLAAAPAASPGWRRAIEVLRPGKVVLTLDRDVYDRARADLGDVRVVDDTGAQAPYLVQRASAEPPPSFRQPLAFNRGFVRGRSATATLDFGAPLLKSELVLSVPGDNFRRRVMVEGRNRQDAQWTTLTDGAYVFAVPGPQPARYEAVPLPENNYQLLRVTVFRGADDPPRLEVLDAWVRPQERRRPREVTLEHARWFSAEDVAVRETVLTVELGARSQPFRGLILDVADPRFFREAEVQARRGEPAGQARGERPWWTSLGRGTVYRYLEQERTHEQLRLEVSGRERALRVRIRNRDDRPLDIRRLSVMAPVERLAFEARAGRRYWLEYGMPDRPAPAYDVERTVGDPAVWIAQASDAALGAPAPAPARARLPWTERHPALLWAGLVGAVLVLGALTWRALRTVR